MEFNPHNKIDALLERFWDGNTSLEEERQLKDHFRFGKVAPEHESIAHLFLSEEKATLSTDFDKRLLDQLEQPKAKVFSLNTAFWRGLAAACFVGAIGLYIYNSSAPDPVLADQSTQNIPASIQNNPEAIQAWKETRAALVTLSSKLNKGHKETLHFSKFNQATIAIKGE